MKMTVGFAIIRLKFGSLSQEAVDNINLIVETCEKYELSYPRRLPTYSPPHITKQHTLLNRIKEYGGWKYLLKYDTGRLAKALGNTPQADGDGIKYAGAWLRDDYSRYNYKFAGEQLELT